MLKSNASWSNWSYISRRAWSRSVLDSCWFVLTRVDSCWLVSDLCWLVLDSCWFVLTLSNLCWLVLDSCWFVLTRVGLVLTRADSCWLMLTCVGLVLTRVDSCWLLLTCVGTRVLDYTWATICGLQTFPRAFSKKLRLSITLDQCSKVLYSMFLLYAKLRAIEIYWN